MRKLFLSLFLTFLGVSSGPCFAGDACEIALLGPFARATARLLRTGVVSRERALNVMRSGSPLSPLENVMPDERNIGAIHLYQNLLSQPETHSNWNLIRAQLAMVLEADSETRAVSENAQRETVEVLLPREVAIPEIQPKSVLGWLTARDHRVYYAALNANTGIDVVDLLTGKPVHHIEKTESKGFSALEETADGDLQAVSFFEQLRKESWWERLLHRNKTRYVRRILNLRTGRVAADEFFIDQVRYTPTLVRGGSAPDYVNFENAVFAILSDSPWTLIPNTKYIWPVPAGNGRTVFVEQKRSNLEKFNLRAFDGTDYSYVNRKAFAPGHDVEARAAVELPNGDLAITTAGKVTHWGDRSHSEFKTTYSLRYFSPTRDGGGSPLNLEALETEGKVSALEMFRTSGGRILVAVIAWDVGANGCSLQVFEPEKGPSPILTQRGVEGFRAYGSKERFVSFIEARGEVIMAVMRDKRHVELYMPLRGEGAVGRIETSGDSVGFGSDFAMWTDAREQVWVRFSEMAGSPRPMRVFSLFNPSREGGR